MTAAFSVALLSLVIQGLSMNALSKRLGTAGKECKKIPEGQAESNGRIFSKILSVGENLLRQ